MFFFKCIPKDIDISCLKSGTIRLDPRVAEHHPQYEDERADTNVKSCGSGTVCNSSYCVS